MHFASASPLVFLRRTGAPRKRTGCAFRVRHAPRRIPGALAPRIRTAHLRAHLRCFLRFRSVTIKGSPSARRLGPQPSICWAGRPACPPSIAFTACLRHTSSTGPLWGVRLGGSGSLRARANAFRAPSGCLPSACAPAKRICPGASLRERGYAPHSPAGCWGTLWSLGAPASNGSPDPRPGGARGCGKTARCAFASPMLRTQACWAWSPPLRHGLRPCFVARASPLPGAAIALLSPRAPPLLPRAEISSFCSV